MKAIRYLNFLRVEVVRNAHSYEGNYLDLDSATDGEFSQETYFVVAFSFWPITNTATSATTPPVPINPSWNWGALEGDKGSRHDSHHTNQKAEYLANSSFYELPIGNGYFRVQGFLL